MHRQKRRCHHTDDKCRYAEENAYNKADGDAVSLPLLSEARAVLECCGLDDGEREAELGDGGPDGTQRELRWIGGVGERGGWIG